MKAIVYIIALFFAGECFAQQGAQLPYGLIYGKKPSKASMLQAANVEAYMGIKTRIKTTIHGKVVKVTKQKGGWFEIEAGNGKVIAAHFTDYNITIPTNLAGHIVIAEGIAQKPITSSDALHPAKGPIDKRLIFEVKGLMVQ